jgi:hypothetical protein
LHDGIECSIVLDKVELTILLLDEAPNGDFNCWMQPVARDSSRMASISVCKIEHCTGQQDIHFDVFCLPINLRVLVAQPIVP